MKISSFKLAVVRKRLLASKAVIFRAEPRKMAILLDVYCKDSLIAFLKLKKDLQLNENDLKIICCGKKAVKNDILETVDFSFDDFSWSGRVSEEMTSFLNIYYDVLISFTASENKIASFLVSLSKARLKVGRKMCDENGLFDLSISAEISEPEVFTAELKKYLKIVNTTIV